MKKYSHGCNFGAPPEDAKKHKERKHIQACEMGGSIYGTMRTTGGHGQMRASAPDENDIRSAYSTLYKKQVSALSKLMRGDKNKA
ncbi:MAG: hypothetical protein GF408_02360 [Candidatus Omnitrophica bacterium]|nr:hypothetical protein [Candidatus Omnitrophota bacterium]